MRRCTHARDAPLHVHTRTWAQSWLPALPEAQELALHYHPFGRYRALASQQLRKAAGQQGDGQVCCARMVVLTLSSMVT